MHAPPDATRFGLVINGRRQVRPDDLRRFGDAYPVAGGDDRTMAFRRPDGVLVVSVYDAQGRLVRRYRRHPDGYERTLLDADWAPDYRPGAAPARRPPAPAGGGRRGVTVETFVGPASMPGAEEMQDTLSAPPGPGLARPYAVEEILASPDLRMRMPAVRVDLPLFGAGSVEPDPATLARLRPLALAMREVLTRSPDEIFLVEAYAEAPGGAVAQRRAEALAAALSSRFGIPAENLVTLGLAGPGPQAALRRITPLLRSEAGS